MAVSERFEGANLVDAGKQSPYWGEHMARYIFAQSLVENKVVLDIACGTGYGLAALKPEAKHVIGVDVDLEAARAAQAECDARAAVMLGDGLRLPFADAAFDVITSFETLEHIHDRPKFLSELKRVLRGGGKLVLSTPNANYTRPVNGKPSNPFHIFEYRPEELIAELRVHFNIEQFLGQMLDQNIQIPPFHEAQMRLPRDVWTQAKLFCWKAFNKFPFGIREGLSEMIWRKPFYPTENDYIFSPETVEHAPVLVAVCS